MSKVDAARMKQAESAVRKFNRMIPALRSHARKVSGNPSLKLQAGQNSLTDGETIWIEPPIKLGLVQRHNGMCNTRADGLSVCPACATQEEVMEVLNHEIGHIVHGSFAKFDRTRAENVCLQRGGYVHDLDSSITSTISANLYTAPTLVAAVNSARDPWLSMLMLIGEDMRCDAARMNFDPTEQEVFDALSMNLLIHGVEKINGEVKHYIDMEDDMQLAMAYLFSARFPVDELEGYFKEELLEIVGTRKVRDMVEAGVDAVDTIETFAIAAQALSLFRKEGYMLKPEADEELEELIKAIQELLKALFGHGVHMQGPDESDDLESKSIGGSGEHSGGMQGLRPEDIKDALESLKHLDHVPENVGSPIVYPALQGEAYRGYGQPMSEALFKSDERNLTPALTQARITFGDNARSQRIRNQRSGRVSGKTLAKRVPFGDDRLFAKRITPDKKDYAVVIGMDISGSTGGHTLQEEKFAVLAMADVLHRLGIKFEVWAHTTEYCRRHGDYQDRPAMYQIKTADEPWGTKSRQALRTIQSSAGNLDGHSLQFYRKRLETMRATERILMYYTDGAMPASNYAEELRVLKSEIAYCAKNNITLMAVGMGVDSPNEHGFDTCQVDGPEDYRKVVQHLGKRLK
ncbi:CobT-like cobalamin biosynthesis protein [Gordonia phage RoyalG]|uniref:CobT-like cobalamin biosynthesis protein n=1 Tax=Gordonia phage RoyalG TaxID=2805837 RepID=A0A890UUJ8_9CAUD|nr:CobT-like cobalamin biosynthesis protein [Gordonia phage RoyalG]